MSQDNQHQLPQLPPLPSLPPPLLPLPSHLPPHHPLHLSQNLHLLLRQSLDLLKSHPLHPSLQRISGQLTKDALVATEQALKSYQGLQAQLHGRE